MSNNINAEESVDYWKQRAFNAEQELDVLREKIASIPDRIQEIVRVGMETMIEGQILKSRLVKLQGRDYFVKERRYENGHAKLVLVDEQGNDFLEISKYRPDIDLDPGEIVLNNNRGYHEAIMVLQKKGVLDRLLKIRDNEICISTIHV